MPNVIQLNRQLHSGNLMKNYPRIERENKTVSPEHITVEMAPFCPPQSVDFICAVVKENPFDHYILSSEIDLQDTIRYFNSLLIYRILKLLYGPPDTMGVILSNISETNSKPICQAVLDWGYVVRIKDDEIFAEVRSIHNNNRFKLRYWTRALPQDLSQKKIYGEKMAEFLKSFSDCIEKNTHLFEEHEEITEETKSSSAFLNIFAEKYNSAKEILLIAEHLDILPDKTDIEWGEKVDISTGGSLYISSAILFIIALETLINTIYHLLIKPEFSHKNYERATIKADLELRFITAHIFCGGFVKPILTPNTELWNRVIKLRTFRNDVIHGNVTPDHYVYGLHEDNYIFFYGKTRDFPGRKAAKKATKYYPTNMSRINLDLVSEIKETVDQIINAILDSADQDVKSWINSWLWEAVVLNFKKPWMPNGGNPPKPDNVTTFKSD